MIDIQVAQEKLESDDSLDEEAAREALENKSVKVVDKTLIY